MYLLRGAEWLIYATIGPYLGLQPPTHMGLTISQCARSRRNSLPLYILGKEIMKLKDLWSKKVWKINPESSKKRAKMADLTFSWMVNIGIYAGILAGAGVKDPKKIGIA
jgi:hypothetical protein